MENQNIYDDINNDKTRYNRITTIISPQELKKEIPNNSIDFIKQSRQTIRNILDGLDDRILVVVGPCSIHNVEQAKIYAQNLAEMARRHDPDIFVVMRIYFEKPRTNIGWKGLIHDPDLDNSCNIEKGLKMARQLLAEINEIGIPCATEFLDLLTFNYYEDLISWGCIGARTSESQPHRQVASGLAMPIGFKNGTTGSIKNAVDGILSAETAHSHVNIDEMGRVSIHKTRGNKYGHVVLRGGWDGPTIRPNYYMEDVQRVCQLLQYAKLREKIMIDCSHGNSMKNYRNQYLVAEYLSDRIAKGNTSVVGMMFESNLKEGKQEYHVDRDQQQSLKYGISITDACINLESTEQILELIAVAIKKRRNLLNRSTTY